MAHAAPTTVLSHWSQMVHGLEYSSNVFYRIIEGLIENQKFESTKSERVNLSEGGIFSSKREYRQVRRRDHVFHICAAPFANGFFISWWLGHIESGFWAWLTTSPIIGGLLERFLKPLTYYKIDTALMFQTVTHGAVLEALDGITQAKGLRALSESERKPIMRDF